MKNGILKKALAVILSAAMLTSLMSVGSTSAGATEAENTKNYYVPSEGTETTRIYFYMPEDWYNEHTDSAGVYWWEGTDACSQWSDMYAMHPTETENIYSLDVPNDVCWLIFNNYINGGWDISKPIFWYSEQSNDVLVGSMLQDDEWWSYLPDMDGVPGESELYREGIHSFDGMIYVLDYYTDDHLGASQPRYKGEWYYYYGNGEYGFTPEKGEYVYTSDYNDIEVSIAQKYGYEVPVKPSTRPTKHTIPTLPETQPTTTRPSDIVINTEPTEDSTIGINATENPWVEDSSTAFGEEPVVTVQPTDMADHTICPTDPEEDIENGGSGEVIDPPFEDENRIYFDVKSAGWSSIRKVYCHIWRFDGTGEWPEWQMKKELCTKEADGRYSFDITATGNTINPTDGKDYGVIFSNDKGDQTYALVMSGACLGDTAYLTGRTFEDPDNIEPPAKYVKEIAWKNTTDCGMLMQYDYSGNIFGNTLPDCITSEAFIAEFAVDRMDASSFTEFMSDKRAKLCSHIKKLNADPMGVASEIKRLSEIAVAEGEMTAEEANALSIEAEKFLSTYSVPDKTEPTAPLDKDVAPQDAKIYFDVESSGWENYKRIYCHIWRYDGTGEWPQWQTRKEQCNKEADGRYSYTLSKTENEFRYSDGNVYGVIFSADTGAQTYEVVMNGKCIGDTVYVTGNTFESPEDSEKTAVEAAWRENKDGGARKRITTTGDVVGSVHPEGYSDETLLADYLIDFYTSDTRMRELQNLFNELVADTSEVLYEVKLQLDAEVSKGYKTQEEADRAYAEIDIILKGIYVDYDLIHDINGDKHTDVMDVTTLQMHLASYDIYVKPTKLDVNGDDIVDVKDVTALQIYLALPKGGYSDKIA